MRRFDKVAVSALVAALTLVSSPEVAHAEGPVVRGEGASFPLIEIEQWRADVALPPYNITIVYNGTSSGQGRELFAQRQVDFGVSDIPYPPASKPDFDFAYVPISAGGLAFMYNLEDVAGRRVRDLKLTAETACKIFTGQITKWSDAEIRADNPRFVDGFLKQDNIKVVLRSGSAGTSFVFGDYCDTMAPGVWKAFQDEWRAQPWTNHPNAPLGQWPVFPNASAAGSSDQNADTVANPATGEGAVTLVETGFAKARSFPVASVQNDTGAFVQPTEAAVTRALSYAGDDPRGTQALVFKPGDPAAYNPSTYSYALVDMTSGVDAAKGKVLATFLYYSAGKGQEKAERLGYAPLSQNLIDQALRITSEINGAGPKPNYVYPTDGNPTPDTTPDTATGGGSGGGGGGAAAGGGGSGGGAGGGTGSDGSNGGSDAGGDGQGAVGDASEGGADDGGASGGGGGASGAGGSGAGAGGGTTGGSGGSAASGSAGRSSASSGGQAAAPGANRAIGAGPASGGRTAELASGGADGGATGEFASDLYAEQPAARPAGGDSPLPLGWVLGLAAGGFMLSRRKGGQSDEVAFE
jgi:phosphate transport system substrate-binding protein